MMMQLVLTEAVCGMWCLVCSTCATGSTPAPGEQQHGHAGCETEEAQSTSQRGSTKGLHSLTRITLLLIYHPVQVLEAGHRVHPHRAQAQAAQGWVEDHGTSRSYRR